MSVQDDLFDLTHSLTKAEKKQVTSYAQTHERNASPLYLKVFDLVNEMEEYDEEIIFKKFREPAFRKRFPVLKHYLFNLILKSLRQFDHTVEGENDLTIKIVDLKRLLSKGVNKAAEKLLYKLKEEAWQYERTSDIIHLLALQRSLFYMNIYDGDTEDTIRKVQEEEAKALRHHSTYYRIVDLSLQLNQLIYISEATPRDEIRKQVVKLKEDECITDFNSHDSFKCKFWWLKLRVACESALDESEKSLVTANEMLDYVHHAAIPDEMRKMYINQVVNSCLNAAYHNLQFDKFDGYFKLLEENKTDNPYNEFEREHPLLSYSIVYNTYRFDAKKLASHIEDWKAFRERNRSYLTKEFDFFMTLDAAYACIKLQQFEEAGKLLDYLQYESKNTRKDLQGQVKILNLILHYQLKNQRYLPYLLRNTYRFFASNLYAEDIHKMFLAFMREVLKDFDGKKAKPIFSDYKAKLDAAKTSNTTSGIALWLLLNDFLAESPDTQRPGK